MLNIKEQFKKIKNTKLFSKEIKINSKTVTVILFVITIFLAFSAGVFVGLEKARFSQRWGENYYHNFVGKSGPFPDRNYMNAHGVFGEVIKINGDNILIKGEDGTERNVFASTTTSIKDRDKELKVSDLKAGDRMVVIGSPNDSGQIEAKFIRIAPAGVKLPPPPRFEGDHF